MTARHITTATLALAAVLTAATAAEAQGHRNAAGGYARHMPAQGQAYAGGHAQARSWSDSQSYGSVRGYVSRSESYSDTGWRGGYGPVETYGGGYAYGAGGAGYAPPVVISHAEPIRGGWGGQIQQSMPFGYPVYGFGRDYSGGAPWTRYRQGGSGYGGYDYGYAGGGYAGGYSSGYGYSQITPPVEHYSYERRDYVEDRGGRYGYSQGYRECGHCVPPPSHRPQPDPEPVYAPAPHPVHVRQRPVHVQAPPVYVQAPPVYVEPAPVYVQPSDVYVQAPPVHVAPADVRVAPSRVHVSQGPVHVAPPSVDVATPMVEFEQAPPPPPPPPRPHHGHTPPSGYYGQPDSRPAASPPPRSSSEYPYVQERGERG